MLLPLVLAACSLLQADGPANSAIDMKSFLALSGEAARHRASHRLTEAEFLAMSREPGTVVLDARSAQKFAELHVRGALNLSFPDFTAAALARAIPTKATRVLIYCNNNFKNAEGPFPTKAPAASLNLSTYVALYTYGYRNVYELGPLLDPKQSKLAFEGTALGLGLEQDSRPASSQGAGATRLSR